MEHSKYVELTIHFRCNLRCKHCMILDSMHWLSPASDDEFQQLLDENANERKWEGLILTGSEVTLRKDLPQLAIRARQCGFRHIRIQTHGMRLANADYCKTLIEAGIDEFFISLTADNAALHDRITEVPGSFEKTVTGLRNLDNFEDIRVNTNTVITSLSYKSLPGVVELLSDLRNLRQFDFWTYWPMNENDELSLIANHLEVRPYLIEAIRNAREQGKRVEVKNFPHCLLGSEKDALVNDQPELRIDPRFWNEFHRNGFHQCVYRDICGSKQCLGINTAYAEKYGWHPQDLQPMPRDS